MKNYSMIEIAIEVAWQIGDSLEGFPRAESRWRVADIAIEIINKGLITDHSEDIDEIISAYLAERGLK
jgi:hypothetical protein